MAILSDRFEGMATTDYNRQMRGLYTKRVILIRRSLFSSKRYDSVTNLKIVKTCFLYRKFLKFSFCIWLKNVQPMYGHCSTLNLQSHIVIFILYLEKLHNVTGTRYGQNYSNGEISIVWLQKKHSILTYRYTNMVALKNPNRSLAICEQEPIFAFFFT